MMFSKLGLVILSLFLLSCSTSTEVNDEVWLSQEANSLSIHNETHNRIYYMVLESEFAALVDWAPGFNGPFIEGGKLANVSFEDIDNGKEEPVQTGDHIMFWWWTAEHMENPKVHFESITIK